MHVQSHEKSLDALTATTNLPVHYANFFRVCGAPGELMIDLGVISQSGSVKGSDVPCERRIAMTPFTAKRMLGALGAALKHYEQVFGCIDIQDHHPHAEKKHAPYGGHQEGTGATPGAEFAGTSSEVADS